MSGGFGILQNVGVNEVLQMWSHLALEHLEVELFTYQIILNNYCNLVWLLLNFFFFFNKEGKLVLEHLA